MDALHQSLDFFQKAGCKVTDHGFTKFRYAFGDPKPVFEKAMAGEALTEEEIALYQGGLLRFLGAEYEKRGLAMQLHLGPIRNNSPKVVHAFGPDGGGDSIGMLTDSRSFTSFVRHEYYRRILCDKLGRLVEKGEYPNDVDFLGEMVKDICWRNANAYFGFEIKQEK